MISNETENVTSVWIDFEKGRQYNRRKKLYEDTDKNYDFYYGNQARYLNIGKETPIVLNIIKSIVKFKLGVVNSNAYAIVYNPNFYEATSESQIIEELCRTLSTYANKIWELQQVGSKIRNAVKDACINDEGILHNYFDKSTKEVCVEVIDKNNIYYGNENSSEIQTQPYIIISYRKPVTQVKEEANLLDISPDKIDLISGDGETLEQAGSRSITDEVNPMCLVLLKYYKKNGKVFYTRAVKSVELEKDVYTDLSLYPISHMVWEDVKGSARGIGAVKNSIPNQIEINKIATRRAIAVKMMAYPKLVANKDMISNLDALEKVGSTIKIKGSAVIDDVRKAVGYLNPAAISADAKSLQEDLQSYTKELEGAGDVATGNIDPTKASGKAILAVQQATQQPLNEQVETYKTFIEDEARIWFDMWKAYKVNGIQVLKESTNEKGEKIHIPSIIKNEDLQTLKANIKIDITPQSPYDRFAQEQSIESLMTANKITFEEYVETLPDYSVMPKDKLQNILKERKIKQQQIDDISLKAQQLQYILQNAIQQQNINNNAQISELENLANETQNNFLVGVGVNEMSQM